MSEPFLILHKVRGEAAFDIAIHCEDMGTEEDPGPWWIIPTSGHRAYPIWTRTLEMFLFSASEKPPIDLIPEDWPDHCHYELDRVTTIDTSPITSKDVQKVLDALLPLYRPPPLVRRKL